MPSVTQASAGIENTPNTLTACTFHRANGVDASASETERPIGTASGHDGCYGGGRGRGCDSDSDWRCYGGGVGGRATEEASGTETGPERMTATASDAENSSPLVRGAGDAGPSCPAIRCDSAPCAPDLIDELLVHETRFWAGRVKWVLAQKPGMEEYACRQVCLFAASS